MPEAKPRVYFAHPYSKRDSQDAARIIATLEQTDNIVLNPFAGERELEEHVGHTYYEKPTREFAEAIVERDMNLLRTADGILAWLPADGPMIGTSMELGMFLSRPYPFRQHGPGPIFMSFSYAICPVRHPFLVTLVDEFYTSVDAFIDDWNRRFEYLVKPLKKKGG